MHMPPHVWGACTLSMILGLFNVVMGTPFCLTGTFSGLHIIIPGVVQASS